MKRLASLLAVFLLYGCASKEDPVTPPEQSAALSSSAQSSIHPLEQVPSELSLEYFSKMRLEGTDFTLGDVQGENAAYTRYTISYKSNGLLISGILNIPKGQGSFPLLILNHGYIDPKVYTNGRGLKREQDALARKGFAVLHTDYRGHAFSDPSPDERKIYDAGIEYSMDVVNAIHAIRAAKLPQINANRIGMLGHSMGGGITLNIATSYPEIIDAIVLYAPVHADAWQNFLRWRDEREEGDRTREAMKTREENPEGWDALSSQPLLKNISVPVLLFQGTRDKDVPAAWSDDLSARLESLGKTIDYVVYPSEGHEFAAQFPDFMKRTGEFFQKHLTVSQM